MEWAGSEIFVSSIGCDNRQYLSCSSSPTVTKPSPEAASTDTPNRESAEETWLTFYRTPMRLNSS